MTSSGPHLETLPSPAKVFSEHSWLKTQLRAGGRLKSKAANGHSARRSVRSWSGEENERRSAEERASRLSLQQLRPYAVARHRCFGCCASDTNLTNALLRSPPVARSGTLRQIDPYRIR
jgi:hypothetical protein